MRGKRIISLIVTTTLIVSGLYFSPVNVLAEGEDENEIHNPRLTFQNRETLLFGNYWQEDTNNDGVADQNDNKVPIRWQVLKKYDSNSDGINDYALVLADSILDEKVYHDTLSKDRFDEEGYYSTWSDSSLRKWLNGYNTGDFYQEAFSKDEQSAILEKTSIVEDFFYDEDDENASEEDGYVKDKVFLLTEEDTLNTEYGFSSVGYDDFIRIDIVVDQSRMAKLSPFAKNHLDNYRGKNDYYAWWLMDLNYDPQGSSDIIDYLGGLGRISNGVEFGVRPALLLNLQSPYVKMDKETSVALKGVEWDTVIFGKYNNKDISWRVLNVGEDDVMLLADSIIEKKAFHEIFKRHENISWKDSSLRAWLNSDFYNESFNDNEKSIIKTTNVINDYESKFYTDGGENVNDKVFLLSCLDPVNLSYGLSDIGFSFSETRIAKDSDGNAFRYWLRSYGRSNEYVVCPDEYGFFDYDGQDGFRQTDAKYGVRPVIHIKLNTSYWKKGNTVSVGEPENGKEYPIDSSLVTDIPLGVDDPITPYTIVSPSPIPTVTPTVVPTEGPTELPTIIPTSDPTNKPVEQPTAEPNEKPTSVPSVVPTATDDSIATPSIKPTPINSSINTKDKVTTFNNKNKAKIKANAKIKIKDKDKIKKITLNGKTIKIKKNKTSFTLKLKSYKKKLKKKGKWNTLKVTDDKGNTKTIKFKTK